MYHQWDGERLLLGFGANSIKTVVAMAQKAPIDLNGKNDVSTHTFSVLILSSTNLQVNRTGIKSRTRSNFGQIESLPSELSALERLKNSLIVIMGKWCCQASRLIFDGIFVKLAGKQDRHKISD